MKLSDNVVPGGLEGLVAGCPELELLDLSNNRVSAVEALRPLQGLPKLARLDLGGCPVAAQGEEAAYRTAVLALLPSLQLLDSKSRKGLEVDEEDSDGEEDEDEDEEGGARSSRAPHHATCASPSSPPCFPRLRRGWRG